MTDSKPDPVTNIIMLADKKKNKEEVDNKDWSPLELMEEYVAAIKAGNVEAPKKIMLIYVNGEEEDEGLGYMIAGCDYKDIMFYPQLMITEYASEIMSQVRTDD